MAKKPLNNKDRAFAQAIGAKIKSQRLALRLSYKEIEKLTGIKRNSIYYWENGLTKMQLSIAVVKFFDLLKIDFKFISELEKAMRYKKVENTRLEFIAKDKKSMVICPSLLLPLCDRIAYENDTIVLYYKRITKTFDCLPAAYEVLAHLFLALQKENVNFSYEKFKWTNKMQNTALQICSSAGSDHSKLLNEIIKENSKQASFSIKKIQNP